MRLLYICDALAVYGGLERVLIEKANWLAKQEATKFVCSLSIKVSILLVFHCIRMCSLKIWVSNFISNTICLSGDA